MKILCGLLGEKLGYSYSPQIHSSLFKKLDLKSHYYLFEIDKHSLAHSVSSMKVLNIKGLNVTIPYKQEVIKFLDELSPEVSKIGAVNTIALKDGKTIGYNTDYFGFNNLMEKFKVEVKDKVAIILGTGGSAKAIYQNISDKGASEIYIVTRNKFKEFDGFEEAHIIDYTDLNEFEMGDIMVNCTPVGMHPNIEDCPVEKSILEKYSAVIDLIYNPEKTKLLLYAEEFGIQAINGLYMLVSQAIKAEELWQNIEVNYKISDEIYEELKQTMYNKEG
ncbi:shikimate dehydrogenase [Clostridium sp. DL1XJH146]